MSCRTVIDAPRPQRSRHGMALVIVLIVIAMLALSAYTFTNLMIAENEGVVLSGRQLQARTAVDSGVAHVTYFLELDEATRQDLGGTVYNTALFQAQLIVEDNHPARRSRFAVLSSELDELGGWHGMRFGLEDESARLNLNSLELESDGGGDQGDGSEDEQNADDDEEESGNEGADAGGNGTNGGPSGGGAGGPAGGGSGGTSDDEERDSDDSDEYEQDEEAIDTSGRAVLMQLPGMTLEIADAILDWIDDDDVPREYGAEFDYYAGLDPPYSPKNGPPESIGELLLVRGITPELLYGRDLNRNGFVDASEQALPLSEFDDGTGSMDRGWASFLTLHAAEKNVNINGEPRIDLNQDDMQLLFDELSAIADVSWATFIVAYRQFGPRESDEEDQDENESGGGDDENDRGRGGDENDRGEEDDEVQRDEIETEPAGNQTLDLTRPGSREVEHLFDLIDVTVEIETEDEEESIIIESPFTEDSLASFLPTLMDNCTVNGEPLISGRININRAPRAVLMTIPGMTDIVADSIINQRDLENSEFDAEYQSGAWPLIYGVVTMEQMRAMLPYVTGGGDVYRAQIVGYFDEGHIFARCEVVIDATSAVPRILSWKDISHLGRGFPLQLLGVEGQTQ